MHECCVHMLFFCENVDFWNIFLRCFGCCAAGRTSAGNYGNFWYLLWCVTTATGTLFSCGSSWLSFTKPKAGLETPNPNELKRRCSLVDAEQEQNGKKVEGSLTPFIPWSSWKVWDRIGSCSFAVESFLAPKLLLLSSTCPVYSFFLRLHCTSWGDMQTFLANTSFQSLSNCVIFGIFIDACNKRSGNNLFFLCNGLLVKKRLKIQFKLVVKLLVRCSVTPLS